MHGQSPTSNFGGTVPPVPLGLRPCILVKMGEEKYVNYEENVNFAVIVGKFIHFCGNRGGIYKFCENRGICNWPMHH